MKEINRVSFEIEHSNGSTYFGFMLSVKEDGSVEVIKTTNCSLADIDGDYIFNTDNKLHRMQADEPISKDVYDEIWDCHKTYSSLHYDYDCNFNLIENAVCCHCGKIHTWNEYDCAVYQGKYLCEDCYQDYYGYCNGCGELYKYSDMNDEIYCDKCNAKEK